MRWFLRNGTSNLVDWGAISRRHIGFTHTRMRRIDNNILTCATTRYFCDTEEEDIASRTSNQLSVKIQKMYGKIEVEGYYYI